MLCHRAAAAAAAAASTTAVDTVAMPPLLPPSSIIGGDGLGQKADTKNNAFFKNEVLLSANAFFPCRQIDR